MELVDLLKKNAEFRYGMLSRMRADCDYYLGAGNRLDKYLWAGNVPEQIKYMKAIWKSFPKGEKPEWLKYGDIVNYERAMLG